jgi:sugar/nucleoside kinase (ribokinase family)
MPDVTVTPPARNDVLCLGRTYCDLIFTGLEGLPSLGREIFAENVAIVPGGGAFITAAHLLRFGRIASLVTRLGTDALSRGLDDALAGSGVGLTFVERAPDAGPQLTVAAVLLQDRAFLSHRAGHGRPATLLSALSSPGIRHIHIAEYATLVENPDLIQRARSIGLTVSLDPSWDEALINDRAFLRRCDGIDVFFPNAEEARALARTDDIEKALSHLERHFPLVVLKQGAQGAVLASDGKRIEFPAPQVRVIDTTGAGDAFNAGFLHHWLNGSNFHACLAAAVETGSLSVQAAGGVAVLESMRIPG